MFYALINEHTPNKISCVQDFDKEPTSPMEFDYIESCYNLKEWKIVIVKVIVEND